MNEEGVEELEKLYPEGPCNRTDPIVRHDTQYHGSVIVKTYEPQADDEYANTNPFQPYDYLAVDAIHRPLIKLNNIVLDGSQISYFRLNSIHLLPELFLSVNDPNNMIQFSDVPGYDNEITVVMIIPVDGIYKKISLNFYIYDCNFYDGGANFNAIFKCMPLEKTHLKQIKFKNGTGRCNSKWCQMDGTDKPNTYQLLHSIAEECGLGFAATQQTKEIGDYNYRLVYAQKLKDVISQHVEFGGLDENSIFDSWIDLWGNIVLVNVPWVLNENVKPNQLATVVSAGMRQTNTQDAKDSYKNGDLVERTISNYKYFELPNNLMIESYTPLTSNRTLFEKGSNNTYNMMMLKGNGGLNNIHTFDVIQKEDSLDGTLGEYEFDKTEFIGFEFSDNIPILKQKIIRKKYFEKLKSKFLKVELTQPNFMLERGMLINVAIFEYDMIKKRDMLANWGNYVDINNPQNITEESLEEDPDIQKIIKEGELDETTPMINPVLSGMYYIYALEFNYDSDKEDITQVLYLARKGINKNWLNKFTTPLLSKTN